MTPSSIGPSFELSSTKHPVLVSALTGAVGGSAGVFFGSILSAILDLACLTVLKGMLQPDTGEGLGLFVGFYCFPMFLCGGPLLGAIPGAIIGKVRATRKQDPTTVDAFRAGMLATGFITLIALVGGYIAIMRV